MFEPDAESDGASCGFRGWANQLCQFLWKGFQDLLKSPKMSMWVKA